MTYLDISDKIFSELEHVDCSDVSQVNSVFKKYGIEPGTIDRRFIGMLKNLPGDEWFVIKKYCGFVMPGGIADNASYNGNSIFMSQEFIGNLGVFAHELGHAKFHRLALNHDKELLRIYNAEKKVYTSQFPESRIDSIDYFLSDNAYDLRGLNETVAETNLMLNTIQTCERLQDRTIFLEQNFPNTIAYLRKKLNLI